MKLTLPEIAILLSYLFFILLNDQQQKIQFFGFYFCGFRINLTFWDDLANVANQHVEKGQQIYVSGRLISDTVEGDDGKEQTYYKVALLVIFFGCCMDIMFVLYLYD